MTTDQAIKKGFKIFPDGTWRKKVTEAHILKDGAKTTYNYWQKWNFEKCYQCGRDAISNSPSRKLRCSRGCKPKIGGTYHRKNGYVDIRLPGERNLRSEHRRVMEAYIGRKLLRSEYIHHINHNRSDNRLENLKIVTLSEHNRIHKPEEVLSWKRNNKGQFKRRPSSTPLQN